MIYPPIIVFGIPRSGTSAVARVLHEKLNVQMALEFKPPDPITPDGHYECKTVNELNHKLISGLLTGVQWEKDFIEYASYRMSFQIPWGFKDPKIRYPFILGCILSLYPAKLGTMYIRTHRKIEQIIKSQVINFGISEQKARDDIIRGDTLMDTLLDGKKCINMDMSERLTDEEISKALLEGGNIL